MNLRRLLIASTLASLLALPSVSLVADDHTPLGEQMEAMGDAFKLLRRQAGDAAQNESTLEILGQLRAAAVKGLNYEPEYTADIPADKRDQFVADFLKDMEAFIGIIDKTIAAVKAGDNAKAEELVGQMRDAQRSGHKAYRRPKD